MNFNRANDCSNHSMQYIVWNWIFQSAHKRLTPSSFKIGGLPGFGPNGIGLLKEPRQAASRDCGEPHISFKYSVARVNLFHFTSDNPFEPQSHSLDSAPCIFSPQCPSPPTTPWSTSQKWTSGPFYLSAMIELTQMTRVRTI